MHTIHARNRMRGLIAPIILLAAMSIACSRGSSRPGETASAGSGEMASVAQHETDATLVVYVIPG